MATKQQLVETFNARAPHITPNASGTLGADDWAIVLMGLLGNSISREAKIYLGDYTIRLRWGSRKVRRSTPLVTEDGASYTVTVPTDAIHLEIYAGRRDFIPLGALALHHEWFGSAANVELVAARIAAAIRHLV